VSRDVVNLQAYRRFRVICWLRCQSRVKHPDDEKQQNLMKSSDTSVCLQGDIRH